MKNLNEMMKTKIKIRQIINRGYFLALVAVLFQTILPAQESTYIRQPGYWTLGINGGLSYQQSDIPLSLEGYGVGLTLAKNLYYKPGAPFAFDLRGRALYAESYGLGYERSYGINKNEVLNGTGFGGLDYTKDGGSTGFVFQNNATKMGELGLEGVISFNRLRERTNVILSLFGGVGIDWYRTETDQEKNNDLYATEYLGIDTTASRSAIRSNLRNILDGEYETLAEGFKDGGKLGIMPSLGLELGYQLTPKFSIGLGHKVTFARNDILDGQVWTNKDQATNDNDIHHYTNLHLRWIVEPKENRVEAPIIQIIEPLSNPHTSYDPNAFVKAKIKNVRNAMDVDYTVNGQPVNFNFNRGQLTNSFLLEPGTNEVLITATNSAGRDQKKIIIAYQKRGDTYTEPNNDPVIDPNPEPRVYRPSVSFTRPSRNTERVKDNQYVVQADIDHVDREEDIYFTVNGQKIRNFEFNRRTGSFRTTINLREGNNKLFLEATNREGRDNDNATIFLEEEVIYNAKPSVEITKPYEDPHNTTKAREVIEARVYNVEQKRDLTYKVNGRTIREFDYDGKVFYGNADLKTGRNTVEVIVRTAGGEDRDQTIIYYDKPTQPQLNPPVVTITSPAQNTTTRNDRKQVKATVLNINDKRDITVTVNNRRFYDFDFNSRSKVLSANISLAMGNNRIKILAQNNDGRDEASIEIKREKEVVISRPPSVNISKPNNNSTINRSNVDLEAKVSNVKSKQDIQVFLNGQKRNDFSFSASRKLVTASLTLRKGSNTILVKVATRGGKDEDQVRVNYKTANPPVVKITAPTSRSTKKETVNLKAKVEYVTTESEIQVFLNGKLLRNFSYSRSKKEVTATLKLKEGLNAITVKVKTKDGSDEDRRNISYVKAIAPPKVTILTPKNNSTAAKKEVSLKANIKNVTSARDITLLINGKKIVSRSLKFKNGVLTAKVTLKAGRNSITVKAVNKGGADEAKVTVNYKPIVQVKKPVVKFISPRKSGTTIRSKKTSIKATVTNVTSKNNIELKVNGRKVKSFNFNVSKKELTANLTLRSGKNKIDIKATNAGGTGSAETSMIVGSEINVPSVRAPKVLSLTNSQPTVDPLNPDVGRSRIIASLQNVTKKSEITLTFNGNKVTNFTYDTSSKKFEAIVDLIRGSNTVKLKVTTRGGKDEKTKVIAF